MDRRQFVRVGLGTAGTLAMASSYAVDTVTDDRATPDVVFYDLGLHRARQIASGLPGGERAVGVHGDPMGLLDHVERLQRLDRPPVAITGVTREAAPFCLQAMLRADPAAISLQRVDQDLFLWTLKLTRV